MTDKEVMQMALDALESLQAWPETPENFKRFRALEALRTALAQPEPVAVWELQEGGWDTIADADWMETLPIGTKLYTAPQKKEWVGLTHEEHMEILTRDLTAPSRIAVAEALLKEKNT